MNAKSFCEHLVAVLTTAGAEQRLALLAGELAVYFKVQPHEVGLFRFEGEARTASFVWPPHRLGQEVRIPVHLFTGSLVSATARQRRGSINNAFAATPHLHVFEQGLAERDHCIPLQKVMTAPGLEGERLRWIVQVSRKGATPAEAGPDFTAVQLEELEVIAQFLVELPL
ncbi:MAG: hypothetical protein FIB02_04705 [Desulfuromonas sp.]|nr:hypothetical protein [Desulfuromonas sp.]